MFVPLRPTSEAIEQVEAIDEARRNELVCKCIHSALVLGQNQTPIKRTELNKLSFPNSIISGALVQYANRDLNRRLGLRLFELDDKSCYLLVNSRPTFPDFMPNSKEANEELTVLFLVLADIIAAPDQKLSTEHVEKSLEPLGIPEDQLKSYLDSFTKRLYLVLKKVREERIYTWGPRAVAEVQPDAFMGHFLTLVDSRTDKEWPDVKDKLDKLKSVPNR